MEVHSTPNDRFIDDKGTILNLLFEPLQSVAIIKSGKGVIRSNHYHKTDSHWLFCLMGEAIYRERNVGSTEVSTYALKPGQMVYTGPNVVHQVEFLEDTLLLSMATNKRTHEEHEADLVRETL